MYSALEQFAIDPSQLRANIQTEFEKWIVIMPFILPHGFITKCLSLTSK